MTNSTFRRVWRDFRAWQAATPDDACPDCLRLLLQGRIDYLAKPDPTHWKSGDVRELLLELAVTRMTDLCDLVGHGVPSLRSYMRFLDQTGWRCSASCWTPSPTWAAPAWSPTTAWSQHWPPARPSRPGSSNPTQPRTSPPARTRRPSWPTTTNWPWRPARRACCGGWSCWRGGSATDVRSAAAASSSGPTHAPWSTPSAWPRPSPRLLAVGR